MEHDFWHEAWSRSDQPGWQQQVFNPHLGKYWQNTGAQAADAVFVPLCGRSLDMQWLHEHGHHVIGIDLSVSAIEEFCKQQSIEASAERNGDFTVFSAPGWTLYAGDFFKMQASHVAGVYCVYDRAALIALPPAMRKSYAAHLQGILPQDTKIFTITIAYDQDEMKGPPFSVPESEVREHFASAFDIELLESASGPEQLGNLAKRGLKSVTEACFVLRPKAGSKT